jgi:hypothetical protein
MTLAVLVALRTYSVFRKNSKVYSDSIAITTVIKRLHIILS